MALFIFDYIQLSGEWIAFQQRIVEGLLSQAVVNLSTTLYGSLSFVKLINALRNQKKLSGLMEKLKELEERGRSVLQDEYDELFMPYGKWHMFLYRFVQLFALFSWHWVITPFILAVYRGERKKAVDTWTPWTFDTWTGWGITMFFQVPHVTTAISGMVMFDSICISILLLILFNYAVLKAMFKKIKFKESTKSVELKFCIDFHEELLRISNEIRDLVLTGQQLESYMCTITFCSVVWEISEMEDLSIAHAINLLELLFAALAFLVIYNYLCQSIAEEASNVTRYAYMNDWYFASITDKKHLILVHERAKKPPKFGQVFALEMNTVVTVLQSGFSYYNVLKAMK